MKYVTDYQGEGRGKTAVIIAGGMSTLQFDFTKLTNEITFGCNESGLECPIDTDFLVYNDGSAAKVIKGYYERGEIPGKTKVICRDTSPLPFVEISFNLHHIPGAGDSCNIGLKVLMLCKLVWQFDEIYLVGYDFTITDGQSHFFGDPIGDNLKYPDEAHFQQHVKRLSEMIGEFKIVADYKSVYNCNPNSALKIFLYKTIGGNNVS